MAAKGGDGGLWSQLRRFDAHPKALDDFRVHTAHGGMVSLVAIMMMIVLGASEYNYSFTTEVVDSLFVNSTRKQDLTIYFDITFPAIHCDLMGVDVNDQVGNPMDGVRQRVYKQHLDVNGKVIKKGRHLLGATMEHEHEIVPKAADGSNGTMVEEEDKAALESKNKDCGDCYGAGKEGQCCDTCDDVRVAYREKGWTFNYHNIRQCSSVDLKILDEAESTHEGCRLYGEVDVTSVAGNFHFAPAERMKELGHNHEASALLFAFHQFNVTHKINRMAFGHKFPGNRNPLDGHGKTIMDGFGMYQYFIKVVPTTFQYLDNDDPNIESNQYSVTEHLRHVIPGANRGLPGVYFFYDISPIQAVFEERSRRGWTAFLISLAAICGGIIALLGLIDQAIHLMLSRKKLHF